jgi:hypothetical protein
MQLTTHLIRRVDDGLILEGPYGAVRICRRMHRIEASYQGSQLVNGSAAAYAERLLAQAIALTERFPFPWDFAENGTQQITDHARFYEQTFMPHLRGIETLKYWIDGPKPTN